MSPILLCRFCAGIFIFLAIFENLTLRADPQAVQLAITGIKGHAAFSTNGVAFQPLTVGKYQAGSGLAVKTDPASTVDFILLDSGTAMRIMPDSSVEFTHLSKVPLGEQVVSDTSLKLEKGSVIGVQRKLAVPSHFDVVMAHGTATIVGTEYVINSGGAVTVLSGSVSVTYNLPGNGGAIRVTVPQGSTFDPVTGTVRPTQSADLQNIVDDINTVKQNAETFKINHTIIVIKANTPVSPDQGVNSTGNGTGPQPTGNPPVSD